jgi:hypothetical protein
MLIVLKSGSLNLLEPLGPVKAYAGFALDTNCFPWGRNWLSCVYRVNFGVSVVCLSGFRLKPVKVAKFGLSVLT